jgi:hypothetical protein
MALTKIRKGNIEPNVQLPHANAAFDAANSSSSYANSAFTAANNAVDTWVRDAANSASDYANSAFTTANNAVDTWVRDAANSGSSYANSAFTAANNAVDTWVRDAANSASDYANSAYGEANTKATVTYVDAAVANSGGMSVAYDSFVGDDTTTEFELSTTPINENYTLVTLNGVVQHKSSYNISSSNVVFSEAPVDGEKIDVVTFLTVGDSEASAGSYANSAYDQANTATTNAATADIKAVSAGTYANAAFAIANTAGGGGGGDDSWARDTANAAFAVANNAASISYVDLYISNLIDTAPATLDTLNELAAALGDDPNFATTISTTIGVTGGYANAAYDAANVSDQRAVTSGVYANAAFAIANTAGEGDSWARDTANAASSYANSSYDQANTATTNATQADQRAVTSGNYANSAFSIANNSITSTLSSTLNAADNIINRPVLEDYGIKGVSVGNTGGATTINLESGNFFTATLSQSCTFTFSNPIASGNFCGFSLTLTNGGAYTITWPASVDWQGGTTPTLTPSGLDMLAFVTYNGGTTWIGLVSGLDIK